MQNMKEILEKISSYNLFNYLLPGLVFVVILNKLTDYNLVQTDLLIGLFLYYFIGLVISRIGSIVIEPLLKKLKIIKFSEYIDFVKASALDTKIETLSEANNVYRTLCSMFSLLIIFKLLDSLSRQIIFLQKWGLLPSLRA